METPELAEYIKNLVTSNLTTIRTDITLQSILDLEAKNALDPSALFEDEASAPGIYICPVVDEYSMEKSDKRGQAMALAYDMVIAMILLVPFTTAFQGDVAPWDEVKQILKFRAKLERFIGLQDYGKHPLVNMEAAPPMETKLGQRKFIGITEYMFDGKSC